MCPQCDISVTLHCKENISMHTFDSIKYLYRKLCMQKNINYCVTINSFKKYSFSFTP